MKLHAHLKQLTLNNRTIRTYLETGKVCIDGMATADGGREVDDLRVSVDASARRCVPGRDPAILHRDEDLAVIYKPSGWLSTPALGRRDDNIVNWVRRHTGEAHAVHRLDEATSGLMMVALHVEAQQHIKQQLAAREISRRYLALVRHNFPLHQVTYDSVLVRNRGDGKRGLARDAEDAAEGKRAVTHVVCRQRLLRDASLVEASLETGRTHQIRIHLAAAGFPVLGDKLYGSRGIASACTRLALHAWSLAFAHPRTGLAMRFSLPLADDLERRRRALSTRLR